jgi:hypothetical protein
MTLDDPELQKLFQDGTRRRSRRDCPSAETLARAAAGELGRAESRQVSDHLTACADCAEEYRLATSLRPWANGVSPVRSGAATWRAVLTYAAAAVVLVSIAAAVWLAGELRRVRGEAAAERGQPTGVQQEAAELRQQVARLSEPQVNVVIADLLPRDSTRGGPDDALDAQSVVIPADARLVTLILNVVDAPPASQYALEIAGADGRAVWNGRGLQMSRFNTFTVAVPTMLMPAGRYRVTLSAPGSDGPQVVERYALELEYR